MCTEKIQHEIEGEIVEGEIADQHVVNTGRKVLNQREIVNCLQQYKEFYYLCLFVLIILREFFKDVVMDGY